MRSTKLNALLSHPRSYCVVNLGCKVNRVESDTIAAALEQRGFVAARQADAHIIVINSCTVTGEAEKKTRKAVRHALSIAPDAAVVVTGCAVAIDEPFYEKLSERVIVSQRADLLLLLAEDQAGASLRLGPRFKTRVPLKVQDGCNRACTYCIVHVARGKAVSTPAVEVLNEAKSYLAAGVKELVLTGIDLGSYRWGDMSLSHLIRELLQMGNRYASEGQIAARVRASSLEPHSVSDDFIQLLASSEGRLCRHLHLPLQSGSSKVLHEMARPYTAESYFKLVEKLYAMVPQLSLTTDIICGFPGETQQEFEETLQLAKACKFSKIHVFPYSLREGTPAALRTDQVPAEEKAHRAAQLRALSDELRKADWLSRKGSQELVLVEGKEALTESYHTVAAPEGAIPGQLISLTL